jgi:hypothetical protein
MIKLPPDDMPDSEIDRMMRRLPESPRSPYPVDRPIPGAPNSEAHARGIKPHPKITGDDDKQVKKAHTEAKQMQDNIERSYLYTERTLQVQQFIFELMLISCGVFSVADGVLTFWGLQATIGSWIISLILACGIGFLVFALGAAVNLKVEDEPVIGWWLSRDTNKDGVVTKLENIIYWCKWLFIGIVIVSNISTNYLGMDRELAGNLFPFVPGWVTALFLSCVIMMVPYMLFPLCDVMLAALAELQPSASMITAENRGKRTYSSRYGKKILGLAGANADADAEAKARSLKPKRMTHRR